MKIQEIQISIFSCHICHSNVCPLPSGRPRWQCRRARMPRSLYGWDLLPGPAKCVGPLQLGTRLARRREHMGFNTPLDQTVPHIFSKRGWKHGWTWLYRKSVNFTAQARHVASCPPDAEAQALANHAKIIPTYISIHSPYTSISQNSYCSKFSFKTSIFIIFQVHPHYIRTVPDHPGICSSLGVCRSHPLPAPKRCCAPPSSPMGWRRWRRWRLTVATLPLFRLT